MILDILQETLGELLFLTEEQIDSFVYEVIPYKKNETYKKIYRNYNFRPISICKITIYPLADIKFKIPRLMKMIASRYSILGGFHKP